MSLGRHLFRSLFGTMERKLSCGSAGPTGPTGPTVRWMSTPVPDSDDESASTEIDPVINQRNEEESKKQEAKYRQFKKVFSTVLFGSTLGVAYYARRRRQKELALNLDGCVRLREDEDFRGYREFYRVPAPPTGTPTCVLPASLLKDGTIRRLRTFTVRPDDVYVASFPKSGTTWVQEIVFLIKNDLDFEKAAEKVLESRFPYLEYPYPGLESVVKLDSPRLLKTHLPYDLLPPGIQKAKLIYLTRNPKDTAVSYFHFARMLLHLSYTGSFENFLDKFKKGLLPYTPFFAHIESYTSREEDPNVLILSYEELSRDTSEVVRKIATFLEKPLSGEEVEAIVVHTQFRRMALNPSVNYAHWDDIGMRNKTESQFMRKGKVGDWHNYFKPDMDRDFELWITENNKSAHHFLYDL